MTTAHATRGGCFLLLLPLVRASWWLLGMPAAYQTSLELKPTTYQTYCRKLQYLVERQRELCGMNPNILQTVGRGAKMGIDECQHQFRMSRWNCTTFSNSSTVFGGVMDVRSREKAYVYAISAAGVAYSVTRACSKGELGECRCDELVRKRDNGGRWKWGGCSDDIKFGARFSKDFVDSGEDQHTPEGLMNIHNNEAGRRGLRSKMELVCKCHGVSGSCSMRVCWRRLKPFREIGDLLTSKFDGATLVKAVERRHKVKLRPVRKNVKRPSKKDLVFLDDSPDYCVRNETTGVLGTRGRLCNSTSYGMDGCRLLCCGRGYQTVIREVEEKCQCKFVWCCRVHCEMCSFKKKSIIATEMILRPLRVGSTYTSDINDRHLNSDATTSMVSSLLNRRSLLKLNYLSDKMCENSSVFRCKFFDNRTDVFLQIRSTHMDTRTN